MTDNEIQAESEVGSAVEIQAQADGEAAAAVRGGDGDAGASEAAEHALVAKARAGDRPALETLLARHQPRIYRFARRMCGRTEDAEDVVQDTMLAVARTVKEFRGSSSLSTWLWTIARSFCIKKRRRSKFAPATEESLDQSIGTAQRLHHPGRDPETAAAAREVEAALDAAIADLEPGNREVLILRDVEGLSAAEVASVTGLSELAVKSRLHRARVAVRDRVAPLLAALPAPASAPSSPAPSAATPLAAAANGSCPDVVQLLSRYLEGEISSDTCAEMERHLAGCGSCRAACASLRRVLAMCRAVPAPEVPHELQDKIRVAVRKLQLDDGR